MRLCAFFLALLCALPAFGQRVYKPSSQSDVDTGTSTAGFVTPLTHANYPHTTIAGLVTNGQSGAILPDLIVTGTGLWVSGAVSNNESYTASLLQGNIVIANNGFHGNGSAISNVVTLDRLGCWWRDLNNLVDTSTLWDAASFSPLHNAGNGSSTIYCVKSNTLAITRGQWAGDGVFLHTNTASITGTFPGCQNFTLVFDYKGVLSNYVQALYACMATVQDSNIYTTVAAHIAPNANNASCALQYWQGSAFDAGTALTGTTNCPTGIEPCALWRRTYALVCSNNYLFAYADGIFLGEKAIDQPTNNFGRLMFGNRYGGGNAGMRGTYGGFALWRTNLTGLAISNATYAFRWLDPATENVVIEGDSTSAYFYTKPHDSWPAQWALHPAGDGKRFYSMARNGISTELMWGSAPTRYAPFKPGGPVDSATLYLWGGINDWLLTNTASGYTNFTITNLLSLTDLAKSYGYKVVASTLMNGYGWDERTNNTARTNINLFLLANASRFDALLRRDLLLPEPTNSYFFDSYHLTTAGNTLLLNDTLSPRGRLIAGTGITVTPDAGGLGSIVSITSGINFSGTNLIHTIGTTNGVGPIDSGGPSGTPFSWTNNYGMGNVVCYFDGDDYATISKNGVQLFTSTPATVLLQPNQYVTLTTNGAGGATFYYERF